MHGDDNDDLMSDPVADDGEEYDDLDEASSRCRRASSLTTVLPVTLQNA